jgi:hypothetical protein
VELLTGGCLCGAVRYQSTEPLNAATLCHCPSCRRASGSHVLGLVTVARRGLQFTAEHPAEYRSSDAVVRTFCSRCSTPLTYWHEGWPNDISLTIGSLDRPGLVPPTDHTWMSEAIAWDDPADGLKRFPTDRS